MLTGLAKTLRPAVQVQNTNKPLETGLLQTKTHDFYLPGAEPNAVYLLWLLFLEAAQARAPDYFL